MPDPTIRGLWSPPVAVATAGGLGLCRPGPGTWASVAAAALGYGLILVAGDWSSLALAAAAALASLLGIAVAPAACRHFGRGDPSQVVIDEVAGVLVGLAVVPSLAASAAPLPTTLSVLLLFRLFDIAKPWPVSALERLPGGYGIVADDLAAGVIAGMLTTAAIH